VTFKGIICKRSLVSVLTRRDELYNVWLLSWL